MWDVDHSVLIFSEVCKYSPRGSIFISMCPHQNVKFWDLLNNYYKHFFIFRYMCLNLHDAEQTVVSLGMIRVEGSMPADKALHLVDARLTEFGLDRTKHIVGAVTDGASVMTKLGKIMGIEHQKCHAHGIHLAVTDVLYAKETVADFVCNEDDAESDTEEECDTEDLDIGDDNEAEIDENQDDCELYEDECEAFIQLDTEIHPIISKIRKIIKIFRKSPVKNDALQTYVKQSNSGKSLKLILDIKTRWNSLQSMLERYMKLRKDIDKTLIDFGKQNLILNDSEVSQVQSIVDVLDTILVGSKIISKNDKNILQAERVMEWMVQKIDEDTSQFGKKIKINLEKRVMERRKSDISGLIRHLSCTSGTSKQAASQFKYQSATHLSRKARDIYVRLFTEDIPAAEDLPEEEQGTGREPNEEERTTQSDEVREGDHKKRKIEELNKFLKRDHSKQPHVPSAADILTSIK